MGHGLIALLDATRPIDDRAKLLVDAAGAGFPPDGIPEGSAARTKKFGDIAANTISIASIYQNAMTAFARNPACFPNLSRVRKFAVPRGISWRYTLDSTVLFDVPEKFRNVRIARSHIGAQRLNRGGNGF
jgi:hypothetical protein